MNTHATKKLVISNLPIELHQAFDAFANAFELSRDQAFTFLLVYGRVTHNGLEAVIPDEPIRQEWRETMIARYFKYLGVQ